MKYFLFIFILISMQIGATEIKPERDFNKFMEGALEVYSQFKIPSKEESEKFYEFVKTKWLNSECGIDCSIQGYEIGKEYAHKNKIVIKNITNK